MAEQRRQLFFLAGPGSLFWSSVVLFFGRCTISLHCQPYVNLYELKGIDINRTILKTYMYESSHNSLYSSSSVSVSSAFTSSCLILMRWSCCWWFDVVFLPLTSSSYHYHRSLCHRLDLRRWDILWLNFVLWSASYRQHGRHYYCLFPYFEASTRSHHACIKLMGCRQNSVCTR